MHMLEPNRVNVQIVGTSGTTRLGRVADAGACGTTRGWYYDDAANPTRVYLCPSSCSFAQTEIGPLHSGLYVQFGCATTPP